LRNYHRLIAIPIAFMLFMSVKGGASSVVNKAQDVLLSAIAPSPVLAEGVVDYEPGVAFLIEAVTSFHEFPAPVEPVIWDAPRASDEFWDRLAYCETRNDRTHPYGNWQNGGRYAGGLGIMTDGTFAKGVLGQGPMGTWERFGGEEFAPSPDKATREEQIIVANRIATGGWETVVMRPKEWAKHKGVPVKYHYTRTPVGFGGWGALPCAGGKPKTYYRPDLTPVPHFEYKWGEESKNVHDLRGILGMKQDGGGYGTQVRRTHLRWLNERGHSTAGVPDVP